MKVLLVLAILAGCDANIARQRQPPQQQLDMVKNAFWDTVAKMTRTAEENMEQIKQSQLGHEFNHLISESTDIVSRLTAAVQTQVAPMSQDLLAKISLEAEQLKDRVESDLSALSAHLQPYADELKEDLERQMREMSREVMPYARAMDPGSMTATVQQKGQELKATLDQGVRGIQTQMGPLADDLKTKLDQNVRGIQTQMGPMAEDLKVKLDHSIRGIQTQMSPLADDLKVKVDQSVEVFQRNMETIAQNFQSQLAKRSREIQRSLTPYGKVNSQNLMEQLELLLKSVVKMTQ